MRRLRILNAFELKVQGGKDYGVAMKEHRDRDNKVCGVKICGKVLRFDLTFNDTIDGERFAGLNIRGFSTIKVFMEILLCCLGHKCSLFSTIKEKHLYSRKNFCGTPENHEKCESLAQQIFPCLRY